MVTGQEGLRTLSTDITKALISISVLNSVVWLARSSLHDSSRALCGSDPVPMFARIGQLARHLSRPFPHYAHPSATLATRPAISGTIMSSAAATEDRGTRMIHTAGCIIIGDEVLGGKVREYAALGYAATC